MKLSAQYTVPAVIVLFVGTIVIAAQTANQGPIKKDEIYQEASDMESFTRETSLLLTLYQQNKITPIYLTNQLNQIDKKMLSVFETLRGKNLPSEDVQDLKKLTDISSEYLFLAKKVEQKTEKKESIEKEISQSKQMTKQIIELEKKYE